MMLLALKTKSDYCVLIPLLTQYMNNLFVVSQMVGCPVILLLSVLLEFDDQSLIIFILLHEKFLQFDWLRAVVFQLNLKYLHVKITNLLRVVV